MYLITAEAPGPFTSQSLPILVSKLLPAEPAEPGQSGVLADPTNQAPLR